MSGTDVDLALAALLATAAKVAPDLPEDLIRKAFSVQKRHQFDRPEHRSSSVLEMQKLVESCIETMGD